jgi:phage protein D
MALPRPAAAVVVDGRELSLPESAAVSVSVEATVGGAHDRATLVLGPHSPWLDLAAGATVELSLGLGDDLEPVLTGQVERIRQVPWGTFVDVLATTAALDRIRVGRVYTSQTVGDIVRDLCSAAGVRAGQVDSGPTLGAYHVDERRTGWRHVRTLAGILRAELACSAAGEVHVRAPRSGSAQHTLRAGAELLGWAAGARLAGADPLPVGPYGAASEQGADAWSLVHHQPGGSGAHRLLPAIRDREAASAIDDAASAAHARSEGQARVVATGVPAVRAGDLVELEDVPRAAGTYRVLTARHQLDEGGFRTSLDLEAAA